MIIPCKKYKTYPLPIKIRSPPNAFEAYIQYRWEVIIIKNYENEIKLYFELKGIPESSIESYFRRIKAFIHFIQNQNKDVETINETDIQQYILYLKYEKKLSPGTINNYISGIRWFYIVILEKEWNSRKIPRMKRPQAFPVIPPKEDVLLLINTTTNVKHKAYLVLLYGSGLRVSEVAKLKISDICSKTMRIRVDHAKHNTNRYTILSATALDILRKYFKANFTPSSFQLDSWLFPGRNQDEHISIKSIKNTLIKLRNRLHLDNHISAHTLRHCFATHSLEDGVEPVFIQQMLGHRHLQTTLTYLHMTSKSLIGVKSPLDTGDGETE
jgi:integrase/recombinase XerD